PSQRRIVQEATTQDGYGRRKVWVHIDLVDETEQERAEREAREQAAREAYERGQRIVRWRDFEPLVPGPGEEIGVSADGPAVTPLEVIGGVPNAVNGTGVQRIIASFVANHPLEDGHLLVLLEWDDIHTDFSDYNPADWSQPWATSATWT